MKSTLLSLFFWFFFLAVSAQTPTVHSSNISFYYVGCNEVGLTWTKGNGYARLVVADSSGTVSFTPQNGTFYQSDKMYGSAYVSHSNNDSIVIRNLEMGVSYSFYIYEWGLNNDYLTSTGFPITAKTTESVNVIINRKNSHICQYDSLYYSASATHIFGDTVHYTWILSYVDTIADNNFMYQHKGYGKYNTKVILRTKNCYVSSETFIDTVAPLPLVDFILHPDTPNNAQVQCLNGNRFHWRNVTINPPIIGLSTDQAIIYWEFGDGNSSYIYNGRNSYSEAGLYEVKLKVSTTKTNNLSVYCADSAMDYVQVFDKIIEDSLIVEYPFIKLGDTLRIAYLDTGFQYWSTSLGTFYNADTMLFLPSLGTYMISLKANAHCDTYSFPITVVDSTPSLFILDEYTLIKGNNDSVQVHLPIAESYLWSTGSTSQNLVFKASNYSLGEHVIWVDVIFNPNFSYRDSFTLKIIDSSASISYLNSLKSNIYPNPGNGKFHLSTGQPVTYKVFTSQGELIHQTGTQLREHTLHLESYPAGVYLIVLSNGQQTSYRRLVIL